MPDNIRELLELAARACGGKWHMHDSVTYIDRGGQEWEKWDPLNEDGDSRRIQVALGIDLVREIDGIHAWIAAPTEGEWCQFVAHVGADPCAAARLAVLKVAAKIGRRMPK